MTLGITKGVTTWQVQKNNVERLMDNAAYTSAHPEDTLILAGPPRFSDAQQAQTTDQWRSMLAIGMMQTFQVTSQKPTQPMMAIGSGRTFYVSGKSQSTWRIGRLLTNGRNLLRVLYHNAVAGNVPVQNFDDPVVPQGGTKNTTFYINLDSELYYVPFGLGVMFKDKVDEMVGAFYCELAMIQMYTLGFTAGQNMVLEDVSGMCDRLFPFQPTSLIKSGMDRNTVDTVIGFTDHTPHTGLPENGADFVTGMTNDTI